METVSVVFFVSSSSSTNKLLSSSLISVPAQFSSPKASNPSMALRVPSFTFTSAIFEFTAKFTFFATFSFSMPVYTVKALSMSFMFAPPPVKTAPAIKVSLIPEAVIWSDTFTRISSIRASTISQSSLRETSRPSFSV